MPEKCVNGGTRIDDVLRTAICPSQAGFDHILVLYTGNQGVCKVVGFVEVSRPRSDDYGSRHKKVADEIKDRVVAKLGGNPPSSQYDSVWDNFWDEAKYWINALEDENANYAFLWEKDNAVPFDTVLVEAVYGGGRAVFEFGNFDACLAERDAANAASF